MASTASCCWGGLRSCIDRTLLGPLPPLDRVIQRRDSAGLERWCRAASSLQLVEALSVAVRKGDPNAWTPSGSLPLHVAIRFKAKAVVEGLLQAGASLNIKDSQGRTALDVVGSKRYDLSLKTLVKMADQRKTSEFVESMNLLSKVPLFSKLHREEYPILAAAFTSRTFVPGDEIIKDGDIGNELFIIQSGEAEVLVQSSGEESPHRVAVLGNGDHFGEEALLHDKPRNATIVALDVMVVKVLNRTDFQGLDLRHKLRFPKRKAVHQGEDQITDSVHCSHVSSPQQVSFMVTALLANSNLGPLLRSMSVADMEQMVKQAFRKEVAVGTEVVQQGQLKADLLFVVDEGTLEVFKNGQKVLDLGPGGLFGELALLFRAPRAATVRATSEATLWVLPRKALRAVMQAPLKKKLEGFAQLLGRVELLKGVPEKERKGLADSLVETTFYEGEYVINQGEEGNTFFVLYNGQVVVEVNGKEVTRLTGDPSKDKADFFGERALLEDEPRAASIRAVSSKVVVYALDRESFLSVVRPAVKTEATGGGDVVEYRLEELQELGLLGCGGFGSVTLVRNGKMSNTFALKALSKGHLLSQCQVASVMNEKSILRMTHSPFLVRLAATFNSGDFLYFLLEPALGGELFTVYQRANLYGSEKHARFYVGCVLRAFQHLHQRQIIYRDLKPENLLLDPTGYCKLTDFGLAKFVVGHTYTTCGTPDYFAPEMVMGAGHNLAVDWWTLGILLYELMMANTPFYAEDTIMMFRKVQRGMDGVPFKPQGPWVSMVKELCHKEPSERLPMRRGGAKNVEEHEWFKRASFSWSDLDNRTMAAPYIPAVRSPTDLSNFDSVDEGAPVAPYWDPGDDWDKDFEDRFGPATFN